MNDSKFTKYGPNFANFKIKVTTIDLLLYYHNFIMIMIKIICLKSIHIMSKRLSNRRLNIITLRTINCRSIKI